eukprot:CCRYP_008264-RA/>CCRYP_008264-RA protein AED:0.26 eAED:0.26 QI:0/-1/0/1/-1/1/1/0/399
MEPHPKPPKKTLFYTPHQREPIESIGGHQFSLYFQHQMTDSPYPRCSSRFNILALTKLSVIVAALLILASVPPLTIASDQQTCVEIKEDFDLRNLARQNNVFLIVHEKDDDSSRKHICTKLEATPKDRITAAAAPGGRPTVFAYLEITGPSYDTNGELQDGGKGFASSLGAKNFPAFAFLSGGMDGTSKYSTHITHYTGSTADGNYLSDVEKFIHKRVGYYLGNDVYNIIFFDSIASKFVSYGDCSGLDRLKQKGLALLVRFSTLFSYKEPFSSIGKLYNKAFDMSLRNGMGYASSQIARLERMMESNGNELSQEKIHEICQKRAILKSFSEPRELTAEDQRQIFIHVLLHFGLVLATILLFVLPSDSGGDDEDEVINAVPVIARVVEDDDDKGKKKHH